MSSLSNTIQDQLSEKFGIEKPKEGVSLFLDDTKVERNETIKDLSMMTRKVVKMKNPQRTDKSQAAEKREQASIKIIKLIVDKNGVNAFTYDDIYRSLFGEGERKKEDVKFLNNVLQDVKARTGDIIYSKHITKQKGNLWSAYGYIGNTNDLIKKYETTKRWTLEAMKEIKERRISEGKVKLKNSSSPIKPKKENEGKPEISLTDNPKEMNFEVGNIKFQIKLENLKPREFNIDTGGVKIQFKY